MCSAIDIKEVESLTFKILDKYGEHPKLTPKLLRIRMATKLSCKQEEIDEHKKFIKSLIYRWIDDKLDKEENAGKGSLKEIITRLLNISKNKNIFEEVTNGFKEIKGYDNKLNHIVKIFKSKGIKISNNPTLEEVNELFESTSKESSSSSSVEVKSEKDTSSSSVGSKRSSSSSAPPSKVAPSNHNLDADEEADF